MKNRHKTFFKATPVIQQEVKVLPVIKEEGNNFPREVGKYFVDISKLVIGGAVITTAIDVTSDKSILIYIAICVALLFAIGGFGLQYKTNKNRL